MKVLILDEKRMTVNTLPDKVQGQINIMRDNGEELEFITNATATNEGWIISASTNTEILNENKQKLNTVLLKGDSLYMIRLKNKAEKMFLFVETENKQKYKFSKLDIRKKQGINISSINGDVFFEPQISGCPIELYLEFVPAQNAVIIQNRKSVFCYLNGKRITEAEGKYGDELYILGLKVILGKDFLLINEPNQKIKFHLPIWEPIPFDFDGEEDENANLENMIFSCSPREDNRFLPTTITIENPPTLQEIEKQSSILVLGPAMTMAGASVLTSLVSIQSVMASNGDIMRVVPTMVMAGSMVLGSVIWPMFSRRSEKLKAKKKNLSSYDGYMAHLQRVGERINKEILNEERYLRAAIPKLEDCLNKISAREISLWERSREDADFLEMYVGSGNQEMMGKIEFPQISELAVIDSCKEELAKLQKKEMILHDVPYTISLCKHKITGIVGKRENVLNFVRGLMIEVTALHNYDELKLVIIYDKEETEWEVCKWLPHIWSNDHSIRFMASDLDDIKQLSNYLEYVVSTREAMSEEDAATSAPYYLIIAANRKLAEKSATIKSLYKNKKQICISMITLYDEEKYLPKTCSLVALADGKGCSVKNLKNSFLSTSNLQNSIYYCKNPEDLFKQLANIKLDILSTGGSLPESITFFDMFKIGQAVQYDFYERWMKSDPVHSLETPIGVDENGEMIMLDIHEKAHGPHGLIAGMTGSGKSEFIISYIASMAMHYSPREVAFILIDFKGGGMADVFKSLPHLVGSITNLDGNELNRALLAIQSELEKRQQLFKKTSENLKISNIDIYKYQSLNREKRVAQSLPHLIIISDEFAELKHQHREFMEQLIRIARIGRSLGVHLILATQKPDGIVDDQIKSNIKFSICLKVQDKADSKSVIDCPDAASIVNAGRFYFKVGMNEVFELGQSAWSGASYKPKEYYKKEVDNSIVLMEGMQQIKIDGVSSQKGIPYGLIGKIPEKQIDALVLEIANVARENEIINRKLWLDKLPGPAKRKEVQVTTKREQYIINPIVGKYDDLKNQTYNELSVPFSYEGNVVVYGVSGSGQLEFINKIMLSMIERYSKEEVQIYVVDFEAGALAAFKAAPHVQNIYCSYEIEKIDRMLSTLEGELNNRKREFSRYGGNYQTYIHSKNVESKPNIIIIIHNYRAFIDSLDDGERRISQIAREGVQFGMFVLITTTDSNSLSFRHVPLYKQIFVLQQNNEYEYTAILGKNQGIYPSPYVGRGIFKRNNTVYEFQTEMIFEDSENLFEAILEYCESLNENEEKEAHKVADAQQYKLCLEEFDAISLDHFPIGKDVFTDEKKYFDFTKFTSNIVVVDEANKREEWLWFQSLLEKVGCDDIRVYDTSPEEKQLFRTLSTIEEINQDVLRAKDKIWKRVEKAREWVAGGKKEPLPEFDRMILVFRNLSEYSRELEYEVKSWLRTIGKSITPGYKVSIIILDKDVVEAEVRFQDLMAQQHKIIKNGLWLGTDVQRQSIFKVDTEMERPPYSDVHRGYIIENGKASLCKLVEVE